MNKVIVTLAAPAAPDKVKTVTKSIAEKLGVCESDVIVMADGQSIAIVDVPDKLVEAKHKEDTKAKADADAAAKAQADAEAKAAAAEKSEKAEKPEPKASKAAHA